MSYDTIAKSMQAPFEKIPYLDRRSLGFFVGGSTKIFADPARLIVPFLFELTHARLQIVDVLLQQIDVLVVEPLVAGLIARDLAHECAEIEQTLFDPIQPDVGTV